MVNKQYYNYIAKKNWQKSIEYVHSNSIIEDVVISGGNTYMLDSKGLLFIGHAFLKIPHIKRIRFATKGLAVMPMKIISDTKWVDAISFLNTFARKMRKDIMLHTHFNHTNEISRWTNDAMHILFSRGIRVRNQTVLLRGVNDTLESMKNLI